jgi:hypothetical protein
MVSFLCGKFGRRLADFMAEHQGGHVSQSFRSAQERAPALGLMAARYPMHRVVDLMFSALHSKEEYRVLAKGG